MRCGKSVRQLAEHPLYNTILAFCWNRLVFSILFDEKYFVYRSIIPNYKKSNGIKGLITLMKATCEQSTVLSFLRFSRNISGQTLLVYHILILIHRGAKLYSQKRANLKILNSAPGLFRKCGETYRKTFDINEVFIRDCKTVSFSSIKNLWTLNLTHVTEFC